MAQQDFCRRHCHLWVVEKKSEWMALPEGEPDEDWSFCKREWPRSDDEESIPCPYELELKFLEEDHDL